LLRQTSFSTLRPSTTLFRSLVDAAQKQCAAFSVNVKRLQDADSRIFLPLMTGRFNKRHYLGMALAMQGAGSDDLAGSLVPANQQDRKSTRLNSSHVKISYAV